MGGTIYYHEELFPSTQYGEPEVNSIPLQISISVRNQKAFLNVKKRGQKEEEYCMSHEHIKSLSEDVKTICTYLGLEK